MISKDIIALAIEDRPHLDTIKSETAEALACYFAGDRLSEYIQKFSASEEDDKYEWRRSATISNFQNYVKEISESYLEGIVRSGAPDRYTGNPEQDEYLSTEYAEWFWHEVAPYALLLPELYIHVTYPKATGEILTEYDRKEIQGDPYPVVVFPHHVKNFQCNHKGELEWISLQEDGGSISVFDKQGFIIIEREEKDNYKVVQEYQVHGFDKVPFVQVVWRWNHALNGYPKAGCAMMHDVVKLTLGGTQINSQLIEATHFHLRLKLIASPGTIQNIQKSGIGNASIIPEEGAKEEGGANTRYLETPNMEIDALDKIVFERMPAVIYRTARLRDRSVQQTQMSGVAKVLDMIPEEGVLKSLCKYFAKADRATIELLFPDSKEITVDYPAVFNTLSATEAISQLSAVSEAMAAGALPQSEYGNQLLANKVYGALLPEMTEEDKDTVWEEIEADQTEEVKEAPPAPPTQPEEVPNVSAEQMQLQE